MAMFLEMQILALGGRFAFSCANNQFHFGLLQQISGLKICNISICIVGRCCWDPQIRAEPEKKIWGSILNDIIDYCVHVLLQILTVSHLFLAFMGLYRAPAGL